MNQLQKMQEIADRIGIDTREAALGIKLARTGRTDLDLRGRLRSHDDTRRFGAHKPNRDKRRRDSNGPGQLAGGPCWLTSTKRPPPGSQPKVTGNPSPNRK